MVKVYISGPITKGNRVHNLDQSLQVQKTLMELGYAPLNPMLTLLIPWAWDVPHDRWVECDCEWVEVADCVLRLPGESAGADQEVHLAASLGLPIFYSIDTLEDHYGRRNT